jgi:hypothetical protein
MIQKAFALFLVLAFLSSFVLGSKKNPTQPYTYIPIAMLSPNNNILNLTFQSGSDFTNRIAGTKWPFSFAIAKTKR